MPDIDAAKEIASKLDKKKTASLVNIFASNVPSHNAGTEFAARAVQRGFKDFKKRKQENAERKATPSPGAAQIELKPLPQSKDEAEEVLRQNVASPDLPGQSLVEEGEAGDP